MSESRISIRLSADVLSTLYHDHMRGMFAVARSMVVNDDEAGDIVQEAFVAACEKVECVEKPFVAGAVDVELERWLFQRVWWRAHNSLRDRLRDRKRFVLVGELPSAALASLIQPSDEALPDSVAEAIASLPSADQKLIVLLRAGYSNAEVGKFLNKSEDATKQQLCRAYRKLRISVREIEEDRYV